MWLSKNEGVSIRFNHTLLYWRTVIYEDLWQRPIKNPGILWSPKGERDTFHQDYCASVYLSLHRHNSEKKIGILLLHFGKVSQMLSNLKLAM